MFSTKITNEFKMRNIMSLRNELLKYNKTLKEWNGRILAEDMVLKAVVENIYNDLAKILKEAETGGKKNKVRENNVLVYSTGKINEWYVRLWLGERKSHGIVVSKVYETKGAANKKADAIAEYIAPLFINKS